MILTFDIGGSAIKWSYAETLAAITPTERVPTPRTDFEAFCAVLEGALAAASDAVRGIAISVTGITTDGRMICANVPAIDGRDLAGDLESRLHVPVVVANDADCFALAEARLGAGRGHDTVFGIILGTGVGGGLVAGGKLINPRGGYAGEWGHGAIVPTLVANEPEPIPHFSCGCGQSGCVDTVGGARGLERLHAHLAGQSLDSMGILARWRQGDKTASRTVGAWLALVAPPLALAINITGASIVPVGGGLGHDTALVAELDLAVRERILARTTAPLVVPAKSGPDAGLIGAAAMGLDFWMGDR
ncbi:ROK family protein [Pelagibacterium limicola]|uniref:ROK family protein n=1 Tax=Pelagibacterium limicola TaxID=2791022 RepID=UPI0018AFB02D|nr:ROK family protein [Pelagibacterium limicola]